MSLCGSSQPCFLFPSGPAPSAVQSPLLRGVQPAVVSQGASSSLAAQAVPAALLACGALLTAGAVRGSRRGDSREQSRRVAAVACRSSEQSVLSALNTFPTGDADDLVEVRGEVKSLTSSTGGGAGAFSALIGDWKEEWTSRSGKNVSKMLLLQMASGGVLPSKPANSGALYYRVVEGGVYQWIQAFTPVGADAEAAMVMTGKWQTGGAEGNWGAGAERQRISFEFESLRVAPSSTATEASLEMLEKAGLKDFMEEKPVDGKVDYFDIQYISNSMRVSQTEGGLQSVFSRVSPEEGVPFLLD
eukprot:TRINITY_DN94243_c0_g1_i1.p1 TRINITY_DN94243_c0_g1~~TRINITY_DN94243_c0_g1_i1.p1  ORF type:complete len:328 (+),score=78.43 TRINITY_DN94243_c0_g1_i1:79-984(+)